MGCLVFLKTQHSSIYRRKRVRAGECCADFSGYNQACLRDVLEMETPGAVTPDGELESGMLVESIYGRVTGRRGKGFPLCYGRGRHASSG